MSELNETLDEAKAALELTLVNTRRLLERLREADELLRAIDQATVGELLGADLVEGLEDYLARYPNPPV